MYSSSYAEAGAVELKLHGLSLALPAIIASSNIKRTEHLLIIIKPGFQIPTDISYLQRNYC